MAVRKKRKKTARKNKQHIEIIEPDTNADTDTPEPEVSDEAPLSEPEIIDVGEPKAEAAILPSDPVARYMAEIRRYPLLTPEQEKELAIRYYEHGDKAAAEQLVTANLRFVVKVAAEYVRFGARMIDLVQEGNIGLMHAVREFNPYRGVKLITYAVWWIRGYIQDYLMKQYSLVKIGTTHKQRKLFYQLQREKEALDRLGPSTVIKQLSGRLDIPEEDVAQMTQRVTGRDLSLSQPLDAGESTTLMDFQTNPDDESTDDQLAALELIERLRGNIEKIRPNLNDREVELLEKRLLADEPVTLQEIGDQYGISREAVRQMEVRVLKKIREALLEDINEDIE